MCILEFLGMKHEPFHLLDVELGEEAAEYVVQVGHSNTEVLLQWRMPFLVLLLLHRLSKRQWIAFLLLLNFNFRPQQCINQSFLHLLKVLNLVFEAYPVLCKLLLILVFHLALQVLVVILFEVKGV